MGIFAKSKNSYIMREKLKDVKLIKSLKVGICL